MRQMKRTKDTEMILPVLRTLLPAQFKATLNRQFTQERFGYLRRRFDHQDQSGRTARNSVMALPAARVSFTA